jgi:hypothetical protein
VDFKKFIKEGDHTKEGTVILAVVFLITLTTLWYVHNTKDTIRHEISPAPTPHSYPFTRHIDGIGIEHLSEQSLRPFGVMIDNSSDARPSVGVEHASLVYETIVEGSITRLLALFDPQDLPEVVGPVRSLRPYYLAWAQEVDSIVTHVGGSPQALREVESEDNINEFSAGQFFYRDENRVAPHNAFSSKHGLLAAASLFEYATTTSFSSWQYANTQYSTDTPATEITVDFSLDPYEVVWKYNADMETYARYLDSVLEKSTAANIIVQIIPVHVIDEELRREVSYIGSGKALIFTKGVVILGNWTKESRDTRTHFTDNENRPILLNPGTTWVEIIDDEGRVTY